MKKNRIVLLFLLIAGSVAYSQTTSAPQATSTHTPTTTVVWISVDGLRGDYIDRIKPPFITRMMKEGAYSRHMQTIFPSITFASHIAEVTGVHVTQHGIPANDFYDRITKQKYAFPSDGALVNAEPIWRTATRQNIRVEVYDWPFSQVQTGDNLPAYFSPVKYDARETDEHRMQKLVDTYVADQNPQPLQLIMGYVEGVDKTGHKYGPDSDHIADTLNHIDADLSKTFDGIRSTWEKKKHDGDLLYFLVTTDHGMSTVKTLVRLDFLLGIPPEIGAIRRRNNDPAQTEPAATESAQTQPDQIQTAAAPATAPSTQPFGVIAQHRDIVTWTSGPIGNVFLPTTLTPADREKRIAGFMEKLKAKPYLDAYRQEDLPVKWQFRSPTRIGDIVIVLKPGYTFSNSIPQVEYPVDKNKGPLGMHGYPVEDDPEMDGFIFAWRSDGAFAGKDLGTIQAIDFHATVCRWLNIQPAKDADTANMGI